MIVVYARGKIASYRGVDVAVNGDRFVVMGDDDETVSVIRSSLLAGCTPRGDADDGVVVILVRKSRDAFIYEFGEWRRISDPYIARGHGEKYAMGALAACAEAEEAVEVAVMLRRSRGSRIMRRMRQTASILSMSAASIAMSANFSAMSGIVSYWTDFADRLI